MPVACLLSSFVVRLACSPFSAPPAYLFPKKHQKPLDKIHSCGILMYTYDLFIVWGAFVMFTQYGGKVERLGNPHSSRITQTLGTSQFLPHPLILTSKTPHSLRLNPPCSPHVPRSGSPNPELVHRRNWRAARHCERSAAASSSVLAGVRTTASHPLQPPTQSQGTLALLRVLCRLWPIPRGQGRGQGGVGGVSLIIAQGRLCCIYRSYSVLYQLCHIDNHKRKTSEKTSDPQAKTSARPGEAVAL